MDRPPFRLHVASLLQAILSGVGLALALLSAVGGLVLGITMSRAGDLISESQLQAFYGLTWVSGIFGLAALPSLYQAVRRLLSPDRPQREVPDRFRLASLAMLVWPLTLASGYAVQQWDASLWLFLPLHTLATLLPLWWLVEFARRQLRGGTAQRVWGSFNFALFVSNPLAVILELVGGLGALIALGMFLATKPEIARQIDALRSDLLTLQNDPAALQELFTPFYTDPVILLVALVAIAGLVPLLEELLKPLAVWIMGGRKMSPAEGFVLGAIAGAAFAAQETLLSALSVPPENWLSVIVGRAGTGALHVATTALMGRAIAEVWNGGGWLRTLGTYLFVVVLHGLWNTFSVLSGFGQFFTDSSFLHQTLFLLGKVSVVFLVLLTAGFLSLLWYSNRQLSRAAVVESMDISAPSVVIAPEEPQKEGILDGSNSERI